MKRLLAIALFVSTLFFAASGILSLSKRQVVHTEDVGAYDEGILPWVYLLGAVGCLAFGVFLWQVPKSEHTGRTTPVEKKVYHKPEERTDSPLDKTGTARTEEALDIERKDETARNAEGVERSNVVAADTKLYP